MFIGSRVEPEWRVEGESHSLTDAFSFCKGGPQPTHKIDRVTPSQMRLASGSCHVRRNCCIVVGQPSESIMGLFKGA